MGKVEILDTAGVGSYNTRHKSLKQTPFLSNFLENPEISTSHCFPN